MILALKHSQDECSCEQFLIKIVLAQMNNYKKHSQDECSCEQFLIKIVLAQINNSNE